MSDDDSADGGGQIVMITKHVGSVVDGPKAGTIIWEGDTAPNSQALSEAIAQMQAQDNPVLLTGALVELGIVAMTFMDDIYNNCGWSGVGWVLEGVLNIDIQSAITIAAVCLHGIHPSASGGDDNPPMI